MKWLNDIKPELVHDLHNYKQVRPYSIKIFIHKHIPKIDFSLTTYDDRLSEVLLKDALGNKKAELDVGKKSYYISQIRFERINMKILMQEAHPVKSFNIHFVTPTYFNTNMGDYPVRFPLPALFFGNLVNIWNNISKKLAEIDRPNFINWVNAHVYISNYKMKTVRCYIGKPKPVYGGIGNASFRVKKKNMGYYEHTIEKSENANKHEFIKDNYQNNCFWLEILCRLGENTNVGANRTAGLGEIRYYPKSYIT